MKKTDADPYEMSHVKCPFSHATGHFHTLTKQYYYVNIFTYEWLFFTPGLEFLHVKNKTWRTKSCEICFVTLHSCLSTDLHNVKLKDTCYGFPPLSFSGLYTVCSCACKLKGDRKSIV